MSSFEIIEITSIIGEIEKSPSDLFDDNDGRIQQKTGIEKIHRTTCSAYELAISAVKKLKNLDSLKENIKFLIYVTQSPSFFLPNHASRIQAEYGISNSAMCFDINQGCSGFVQALYLMNSLIGNSSDCGLIICSDTYSAHLSENDRSTQVLFSDGATATLIRGKGSWQIIGSKHLTDGSGADKLVKSINKSNKLYMDGASIFQWTRRELGKQIKEVLIETNCSISNIEKFYLHQASKLVITNVIKSLEIETSKVPTTLGITGNLVSSSIPFLLEQNFGDFNSYNLVLLSGFGVGLSSSTCLLKRT